MSKMSWIIVAVAVALITGMYACGSGLPRVPDSPERILADADSYFDRNKFFQAQELYRAFLERHPGDDRSDYAQFKLAESLYGDRDWALAAVEYRILVTNYGYSEYADDGYLKEALCFANQASDAPHDQSKRLEALDKLHRFVKVFTNSPLLSEAQKEIEKNNAVLAEKALRNALFYMRYKRPKSGEIYLDKIIDNYPDNEHWCRALYYKGKIEMDRGHEDEALALFGRVMTCSYDVDEKALASDMIKRLKSLQPSSPSASNGP